MRLKLIMVVFFLGLGVALLVWQWLDPMAPPLKILNTGISAGWLAIFMGLINLVRWWAYRAAGASAGRDQLEESALRRHRREKDRQPREYGEPDPNFDFSDSPPRTDIQRGDGTSPPA